MKSTCATRQTNTPINVRWPQSASTSHSKLAINSMCATNPSALQKHTPCWPPQRHTAWKRLTPIVVFYCIMTTSACETCENGPLPQCFAVWRCRARLGCSSARKWTVLTWICSRPASVAQIQQGLHKFVRGLECQRRRLPLRSVLVRRTDLHRDRIGPYADGLG